MNAECEDLIRRLLCIDPAKRITIPEIVSHRWMKMGGEDAEFDRLIAESMAPDDMEVVQPNDLILDQMTVLGLDRDKIIAVCWFSFDTHAFRVAMMEKLWPSQSFIH
jgi:serine/threonine protein kinase